MRHWTSSNPTISVRDPEGVKKYGQPDKPYLLQWYYPCWHRGFVEARPTRRAATEQKALDFAIKHRIHPEDMPVALRTKLRSLARTLALSKPVVTLR